MTKTTTILAQTPEQYEKMVFEFYLNWCENLSINNSELQQIFANSSINKYFMIEYAKCEVEFYDRIKQYVGSVSQTDILNCYNNCTFRMHNIRPMALLKGIKRPKVNGVQIPRLTFNLN